MTYAEALHLLNQAADEMMEWQCGTRDRMTRNDVRAEIRLQLWEAEKAIYDRGFAAAAALHTELSSPTQPQ